MERLSAEWRRNESSVPIPYFSAPLDPGLDLLIQSLLRAQTLEQGFSQWQLIPTEDQEMDLMRGTLREGGTQCATFCLPISQFGEDWRGSYKIHLKVQVPGTLEDKQTFILKVRQGRREKKTLEVQAHLPGSLSDSCIICSTLEWFSKLGFHSLTDSGAGLTESLSYSV